MNREYRIKSRNDSDLHHILYPRKYHRETYAEAAYIAEIVVARDMWRPIHDELHAKTSPVPPLGYYALCIIARDIQPSYDNTLEAIDDYSKILEKATKHPKCKPGEAALNLLHLETIREQVPFIEDAMDYEQRRIIA